MKSLLKKALPKGAPVHPGGGTARLFAPGWVIWSEAPERFEAGTPAIINIIALAIALLEKRKNGDVEERKYMGVGCNSAVSVDGWNHLPL